VLGRTTAFLVLTIVARLAYATDTPVNMTNTARGIPSNGAFQTGDIDAISLFNGNVTISVPLPSYPLDGGSSYAVHLVYTGIPWDLNSICKDKTSNPPTSGCTQPTIKPNKRSNAGLGWRVSMGSIVTPQVIGNGTCSAGCDFQYESPDGSQHRFYSTLHPSDTVVAGVFYTHDNTYLRLEQASDGNPEIYAAISPYPAGTKFNVDFPDGMRHSFDGGGKLVEIRPPRKATSSVVIKYLSGTACTPDQNAASCWRIDDFTGSSGLLPARSHWVTFDSDINLVTLVRARKIILAGMASGGPASLTYQLNYGVDGGPADTRINVDDGGFCYPLSDSTQPFYDEPLLTRIDLPDTSTYKFSYFLDATQCSQASMQTVTLPTSGTVAYTYQNYMAPILTAADDVPWVPGVKTRTRDNGTWLYETANCANSCDRSQFFMIDPTTTEYREFKVTVTRPDGAKEIHFFSTARHPSAFYVVTDPQNYGWDQSEYGLPLTHRLNSSHTASDNTTRYLSSQILRPSDLMLVRTAYVAYDNDGYSGTLHAFDDNDRRIRTSLTRFDDDSAKYSLATNSDFDGLGHYRTTSVGDFGLTSSAFTNPTRTTVTNFNPGRGTYNNGGGTTIPDPASSWILQTFDYSSTTAGGQTIRQDACFGSDGFLLRSRSRATATAIATNDILADYTAGTGNVVKERYFGGDSAPTGGGGNDLPTTGTLCSLTLPAARYELRHEYQYGVLSKSTYYDANGMAMAGGKILDLTVDPSGMATASTDAFGIGTSYTYDSMLRTASVSASGTATTSNVYTVASGSTPATVTQKETFIGFSQPAITRVSTADSYGRIVKETRTMPGGMATRATSYDYFNHKTGSTEWEFASTPASYTIFHYDLFGQVDSTTLPDASQSVIGSVHTGVSTITRTSNVNGNTATTVEKYDGEGHLISVLDPAQTPTSYQYDAGNHLSAVCVNSTAATPCNAAGTQARSFTYDGRGFLVGEHHPETGSISYSYDARGHALTKSYGTSGAPSDLRFSYDRAERLLAVSGRSGTGSTFRALKSFAYDTLGTYTANGKLVSATRENYDINNSQIEVAETYVYNDTAGRLSDRTTTITDKTRSVVLKTVSDGQAYDGLGEVTSISYPQCDALCGQANWASVSPNYTNGFLTSIGKGGGGFLSSSITYGPTGMVTGVAHSNGVNDAYTQDGALPRPATISFSGWSSCTPPSITTHPAPNTTVTAGSGTTLSVAASGTGLHYQWYQGSSPDISHRVGTDSSSFSTGALSQTTSYYVVVYNACSGSGATSNPATVTVGCNAPAITSQSPSGPVTSGTSTSLSVTATGDAMLHYHWYLGLSGSTSNPVGTDSPTYTTPVLTATARYWVQVTNGCGSVNGTTIVLTIPLSTPTGVIATASGSTVTVTWNAVPGSGIQYAVQRREAGIGYHPLTSSWTSTSYPDSVSPGAVYVYCVQAADSFGGSLSNCSVPDVASTLSFSTIGLHPPVAATHFEEIRTAINALRAVFGLGQKAWSVILPAGVPAPASNVPILAQHITSLRSAMNSARGDLQLPLLAFGNDPSVTNTTPIRLVHITDLQAGVK
jgi:YD repeat-containing protein